MIAELKGARILDGLRGQPPVDKEELAELLVRLSRYAHAAQHRIKEIDVNPLVLDRRSGRLCALDALVVLRQAVGATIAWPEQHIA
jgi:succinyl-CoA synthetase beta subunit